MISTRVTESYMSLFLKPKHGDGSRAAAIARMGTFEVRLIEMQTVNASDNLWVELYDRDLQIGVDSCKCTDLDEAIDAVQYLIAQVGQINSEVQGPACTVESRPSDL